MFVLSDLNVVLSAFNCALAIVESLSLATDVVELLQETKKQLDAKTKKSNDFVVIEWVLGDEK
jgi:hypothetical protein